MHNIPYRPSVYFPPRENGHRHISSSQSHYRQVRSLIKRSLDHDAFGVGYAFRHGVSAGVPRFES